MGIYFTTTTVTVIRGFRHSQCFVLIGLSQNCYLGNALLLEDLEYHVTFLPEQPTVLWEAAVAGDPNSQLNMITLGRNEM